MPEDDHRPTTPYVMNSAMAAKLRADFPPDAVGKLPRTTCRACSADKAGGCCGQNGHRKAKCDVCGNWMTTAHMHLDYVGHADATARFLDADPWWSWQPVPNPAERGLPCPQGCLWIELTIGGVTRLGFGDADGKTGPSAIKEVIGDALRNAGMRFGVGLSMWMKGDRDAARAADRDTPEDYQPAPAPPSPSSAGTPAEAFPKGVDPVYDAFAADGPGWGRRSGDPSAVAARKKIEAEAPVDAAQFILAQAEAVALGPEPDPTRIHAYAAFAKSCGVFDLDMYGTTGPDVRCCDGLHRWLVAAVTNAQAAPREDT